VPAADLPDALAQALSNASNVVIGVLSKVLEWRSGRMGWGPARNRDHGGTLVLPDHEIHQVTSCTRVSGDRFPSTSGLGDREGETANKFVPAEPAGDGSGAGQGDNRVGARCSNQPD